MRRSSIISVRHYFIAVLLLSAPFWFLGTFSIRQLLPGVPVSALMVVVPGLVAFITIFREEGRISALLWLKDALSPIALRRTSWVLIGVLLPPAILAAAYMVMFLFGYFVPNPNSSVADFAILLTIFLVPAILEELGWSSFASARLSEYVSAFKASLLIGAVWAVWHVIPLSQAGRSVMWIVWWCLGTVALRILITWTFNNAGKSALVAGLFHASVNASWQSFPIRGSHYDPAIHAFMLVIVSGTIVVLYGAKTLTREAPFSVK